MRVSVGLIAVPLAECQSDITNKQKYEQVSVALCAALSQQQAELSKAAAGNENVAPASASCLTVGEG